MLCDLEQQGYILNPYDPCVINKIIKNNIHTVVWHVDDLKALHVDPKVNDKFIDWIKSTYASNGVGQVKTSCGLVHNYLGMVLDYTIPGAVKINMEDYITRMLDRTGITLGITIKRYYNGSIYHIKTQALLHPEFRLSTY